MGLGFPYMSPGMKKLTGGRSRNVGDEEYSWGEVNGVVDYSSRRGGVSVRSVRVARACSCGR